MDRAEAEGRHDRRAVRALDSRSGCGGSPAPVVGNARRAALVAVGLACQPRGAPLRSPAWTVIDILRERAWPGKLNLPAFGSVSGPVKSTTSSLVPFPPIESPSGARRRARSTRPSRPAFSRHMNRVLRLFEGVQKSMEVDAVHDFRVALRRCRAVAETMLEVDAHPDWRALKRKSRGVFQTLGALRDVQILKEWVVKLTSADDSIRRVCLDTLQERELELAERARRSMDEFDRPAWKRLGRKLSRRVRLV